MSSGDADSSRLLNPFGGGHYETIKTCLGSKRVELHTVKCGVMQALPQTEKLDGVAVAHPVLYGEAWVIAVAITGDVC